MRTDVLVAGASLGGVSAALAALRLGSRVVLCAEPGWLGGQLTSQAVAPDEHPWIEAEGCSASYRHLRRSIRDHYLAHYPVRSSHPIDRARFNPGQAPVSRIAHEPRVAVAVIESLLAPYRASRQLTVVEGVLPVRVDVERDRIRAVSFRDPSSDWTVDVEAQVHVDATELGDLLELGGIEHVVGAEARSETGEMHAPDVADPRDQQAVTACFAFDFAGDGDDELAKPDAYDYWRRYADTPWGGLILSWESVNLQTRRKRVKSLIQGPRESERGVDLWHYRRILFAGSFEPGFLHSDIVLANWHQNDYWESPIVVPGSTKLSEAETAARELSRCLAYWLQHDAPRHDGGTGYPELRMRPDVTGTRDGLAQRVYIRESRRIRAVTTVLEQDLSVDSRSPAEGATPREDSVGVGYYNIDLHPSPVRRSFLHVGCHPFQIPMGALLPVRCVNLLPGCKNLGTTHVTNGAFRMHPIEWSIGEAAGALAAYCSARKLVPPAVRSRARRLREFQGILGGALGVPLEWPRYVALDRSLIASAYWPPEGLAPEDPSDPEPAPSHPLGWA